MTLEQWLLVLAKRSLDCLRRGSQRTKRGSQEASWETPERDGIEDEVVKCLYKAIETLTRMQRAVIEADMSCWSGKADTDSLAHVLKTSKDAIFVHRNKAHERIRKYMTSQGFFTLECEVIHDI
jgi:hypothetical protein